MLDTELNEIDPPKVLNETALGHIIDVIDLYSKTFADRLEKNQKIKARPDTYKFTANPDSMNMDIGFDIREGWSVSGPIQPKTTHFIITEKANPQETKQIKNWFERQQAKRRWILQILVMNREHGKDPDDRF